MIHNFFFPLSFESQLFQCKCPFLCRFTRDFRHAIVEELASFGASIYTCSRNKKDLDECLEKWQNEGYKVNGSICDLLLEDQRIELIQKATQHFNGKLDILVSNTNVLQLTMYMNCYAISAI